MVRPGSKSTFWNHLYFDTKGKKKKETACLALARDEGVGVCGCGGVWCGVSQGGQLVVSDQ